MKQDHIKAMAALNAKDRIAYLKKQLAENDSWAVKALLRIYELQTNDEKETHTTRVQNGVGFTGTDAEILTSFVQWFTTRGFLTSNQMALLKKKMPKYAGQIYREFLKPQVLSVKTQLTLIEE